MKTKTKKIISLLLAFLLLVISVTAAEVRSGQYGESYDLSAADDGAEFERGDVNLDGRVDSTDTIVMKRHFLSFSILTDKFAQAADLDGSGVIDMTDYILLKRILLKIDVIHEEPGTTSGASSQTACTDSSATTSTTNAASTTTVAEVTETTEIPYSPNTSYKLSYNNITNISRTRNVFVFVIDRFDRVFAETAFLNDPAVFSELEGFTYFEDHIALYGHTYPSIAYMITGNKFNNEIRKDYLTDTYYNASTLKELRENNYQVNVYTSTYFGYIAGNSVGKYISNAVDSKKIKEEYKTTLDTLEEFYADAEFKYVNKKVYSFIHLEGCHDCYFGGGTPAEKLKASQIEKAVNALRRNFAIINKYIQAMKNSGVYDDATIIITGDHGSALSDTKVLDGIRTTALFVKPSGKGSGNITRSSAQVSHDNLWATIFQSEGIEPQNDYGASIFDIPADAQMTRVYNWHMFVKDPETEKWSYIDYKYTITGSALDFANWTVTGEVKYDRSVYS